MWLWWESSIILYNYTYSLVYMNKENFSPYNYFFLLLCLFYLIINMVVGIVFFFNCLVMFNASSVNLPLILWKLIQFTNKLLFTAGAVNGCAVAFDAIIDFVSFFFSANLFIFVFFRTGLLLPKMLCKL